MDFLISNVVLYSKREFHQGLHFARFASHFKVEKFNQMGLLSSDNSD